MFRFLVALCLFPVVSNAQTQPPSWEQYLDQAIELQNAGRLVDAEEAYGAAMREAERLGADDPAVARVSLNLSRLRILQHDYTGARLALERTLGITERAFGPEYSEDGLILTNLAMIHHLQGRYAKAEALYGRALAILEKSLGPAHRYTAQTEAGMAKLFLAQGRNTEAEALFEKAIPVLEISKEPDDPGLAIALISLAEAYRNDGRYSKAEPLYRRVMAIVEDKPGLRTEEVRIGLLRFPAMLRKMKRRTEARELDEQLKTLLPR